MNAARFLEIIQKRDSLEGSEVVELQKIQESFPYFQIPYILTARYAYRKDPTEHPSSLAHAAITSPDRVWLKTLVETGDEKEVAPRRDLTETVEEGKKKPIDLIKGISKRAVRLESIKEIEAKQHIVDLAAGHGQIKYNLSAATMRLTVEIDVEYVNASNEEETLKRPFTFFKDYDPRTTTLPDMEKVLVDEIFTIIQDIFTSADSNPYFNYIQAKRTNHVNAAQFLEIVRKPDPLDRSEIQQLHKVQENFPYFQIPHVLTARYEYIKDSTAASHSLGYAAITSPDRAWLKTLVEKANEEAVASDDGAETPKANLQETTQTAEETKKETAKPAPAKPKPRKRKPPKDDLIEMIKKKEKKEILDEKKKEQIDLIRAFSKKEIKMATIKEIEANQNTENLAAASTQINDNLVSESYAKILASQGKKQLAKEIYEKLVLKFPDKRAYFADLIEKLKD